MHWKFCMDWRMGLFIVIIPFDMKEVRVSDKKGKRVISDYEELKEWWNNEK